MYDDIVVHPRIKEKHPDITNEDVVVAWKNAQAMRYRNFDLPSHIIAAGADNKGRMLEMVGAEQENGTVIVYHAMKLTPKIAKELNL